jgi:acetyltransferase-like isoleucine patch superfamily enzyme
MISIGLLFKKIGETGIRDSLKKARYYFRGLFYRIYFEKWGPIQVTGKIYIKKKNARIKIGKCLIWKHVKIDMEGKKNKPAIIEIGDFTTIGDRTELHAAEKITIGRNCKIAWDCVILDRNYHGIWGDSEIIKPVIIEDDVWIGCRSIILPGVTLGSHAIVAAGSVVTKNVAPFTMVGGNPARQIKKVSDYEYKRV